MRYYWFLLTMAVILSGCRSPEAYREELDETAGRIIAEKQQAALGKVEPFEVERPSTLLRRRLLADQDLQTYGPASWGSDVLEPIEHWPEAAYPEAAASEALWFVEEPNEPLRITLTDALQIGARNSFRYQRQKETVFASALDLELERDEFRNTFFGVLSGDIAGDFSEDEAVVTTLNSGSAGLNRRLKRGGTISTDLAVDLAHLLTQGGASTLGLTADTTVTLPLLRGAGRHIVTEPLVQAERDVIYAMWDFERYKKEFAVDVARNYLAVLQQLDSVNNSRADYRSRIASARRIRRLADAGRVQEIEVDQAVQNELQSRRGWISAIQRYEAQLDGFKTFLGLPIDARIELDPCELDKLAGPSKELIQENEQEDENELGVEVPAADAPIELEQSTRTDAGPYELEEQRAIRLAYEHRLDLRTADGRVYDAQREVVVAADRLGAELTLGGTASFDVTRAFLPDNADRIQVDTDEIYSGILTLNLPLERTAESVSYRRSYINLEQAVRNVQSLEDTIKSSVRDILRNLRQSRENIYIQAKSVVVAQKRVDSVNMFLEAGRAEVRDLLEAQDALLSAQNALTSAIVEYRIAELELQQDMGVLEVNYEGLWREFEP